MKKRKKSSFFFRSIWVKNHIFSQTYFQPSCWTINKSHWVDTIIIIHQFHWNITHQRNLLQDVWPKINQVIWECADRDTVDQAHCCSWNEIVCNWGEVQGFPQRDCEENEGEGQRLVLQGRERFWKEELQVLCCLSVS